MDAVATLVKSIFQKDSLQDCSIEELQTVAQQHPYFTPVQFLLAEKLRATDEILFKQQLQKLSLHFSNSLWLDYLLNGYTDEPVAESTNEIEAHETPVGAVEEEDLEAPIEPSFIKSDAEIVEPIREEINETTDAKHDIPVETVITDQEKNLREASTETIEEPGVEMPQPVGEEMAETEDHQKESQREQEKGETFGEVTTGVTTVERGAGKEGVDTRGIPIPGVGDLKKEPPETQLTFEPYHTVDYFASQGIKFVPEDKPADRFGRQLKSFTEWLKTMKRLPYADITKMADPSADPSAEQKVQQLADHSITEEDVVTETMAEVWAKQGNKEKAIEIYNKLSLLNPDKSAYFASLIHQLKNS